MSRMRQRAPISRGGSGELARPRLKDRPGYWKLLWRRQRRMQRPAAAIVLLVLLIAVSAGVVHALGQSATFGERFGSGTARLGLRIQNVVIQGRQRTPEAEVANALSARPGLPILTFSVADAKRRLEQVPWVQTAIVERRLPDTILVQLTERRPFAVWQHDGRFVLVDRNGDLVTDADVASFAPQLPLIVGTGAPQAAAGLMDALASQPDIASRMVAAVRVGGRRWNLRMKNGADVLLPEAAEVPALAKLAELQTSNALLDRPLRAIDLRLPDRLMLRPQSDKTVDTSSDKSGSDKSGDKANDPQHPAAAAAAVRKPT
jgi:cell division protein FtsQ